MAVLFQRLARKDRTSPQSREGLRPEQGAVHHTHPPQDRRSFEGSAKVSCFKKLDVRSSLLRKYESLCQKNRWASNQRISESAKPFVAFFFFIVAFYFRVFLQFYKHAIHSLNGVL